MSKHNGQRNHEPHGARTFISRHLGRASSDDGQARVHRYSLSVLVLVERRLAIEWHVTFRADVAVVLQCVRHVRAMGRCVVRLETESRRSSTGSWQKGNYEPLRRLIDFIGVFTCMTSRGRRLAVRMRLEQRAFLRRIGRRVAELESKFHPDTFNCSDGTIVALLVR